MGPHQHSTTPNKGEHPNLWGHTNTARLPTKESTPPVGPHQHSTAPNKGEHPTCGATPTQHDSQQRRAPHLWGHTNTAQLSTKESTPPVGPHQYSTTPKKGEHPTCGATPTQHSSRQRRAPHQWGHTNTTQLPTKESTPPVGPHQHSTTPNKREHPTSGATPIQYDSQQRRALHQWGHTNTAQLPTRRGAVCSGTHKHMWETACQGGLRDALMVCMTVICRSSFRRWKEALAPQAETSDLSQKLRFKVHSTSIGNKCMHWSGLLVAPLH